MEIRVKDLMQYYGCCRNTAEKRMREIKKYYGITDGRLSFYHLAKYEQIPVEYLFELLRY